MTKEVRPRIGEGFEDARNTALENGVKIAWEEFSPATKQDMQEGRRARKPSEQNNVWMRTTVGASVISWPLIVGKRCTMKNGKILCRIGMMSCTK